MFKMLSTQASYSSFYSKIAFLTLKNVICTNVSSSSFEVARTCCMHDPVVYNSKGKGENYLYRLSPAREGLTVIHSGAASSKSFNRSSTSPAPTHKVLLIG